MVLASWNLNKQSGCSHISSIGSLGRLRAPAFKSAEVFLSVTSRSRAPRTWGRGFAAWNNHPFRLIKMRHCGKTFSILPGCSQRKTSSLEYTTRSSRDHPYVICIIKQDITVSKGTPPEVLELRHLKLFTGNQFTASIMCLPTCALGGHVIL